MASFPLYVTGFSWKPSVWLVVVDYSRKPMAWPPHFEMPDGMEDSRIPSSRMNNASCCCDLCNKFLSLESRGSGWYLFPAATGNSVLFWQTDICLLKCSPTRKSKKVDLSPDTSFLGCFRSSKTAPSKSQQLFTAGWSPHTWWFRTRESLQKDSLFFQVLELYGILYRWWFPTLFIFTWGNDPIWAAYFSNGLKPLTTTIVFCPINSQKYHGSRCGWQSLCQVCSLLKSDGLKFEEALSQQDLARWIPGF